MARPTRPSIGEVTLRELEIQLRGAQRGFDRRDLRGRLLRERRAAIALFVRDRVLAAQPLGALELAVGALHGGARASRASAVQPIDLRLERSRVDLEQQVALADDRAFGEANGGHEPGHPRPDFDGVDGLEATGEFIPFGHVALDDAGDGDLRRRRRRLLRGGLRARREK